MMLAIATRVDWRCAGRELNRVHLCTHDGQTLSDVAMEISVCVSREKLLGMRRGACDGSTMVEGASFSRIRGGSNGTARAVELFFGCDGARGHIRLSLATTRETLDVALGRMQAAWANILLG